MNSSVVINNPARLEPLKPLDIELFKTEEPDCVCCSHPIDYVPPAPSIIWRFNPFASMPPNVIPYGHIVTVTGKDGKSITQMHEDETTPKIMHWAHRYCMETMVKAKVLKNEAVTCCICKAIITNPEEIVPQRTQIEKIKKLVVEDKRTPIAGMGVMFLGCAVLCYYHPELFDGVADGFIDQHLKNIIIDPYIKNIIMAADFASALRKFISLHPKFVATQTALAALTLADTITFPRLHGRRDIIILGIKVRAFGVSGDSYNALRKAQMVAVYILAMGSFCGTGAYTAYQMTNALGLTLPNQMMTIIGGAFVTPIILVALITITDKVRDQLRRMRLEQLRANNMYENPQMYRLENAISYIPNLKLVFASLALILAPYITKLAGEAICTFTLDPERFSALTIIGADASAEATQALGTLFAIYLIGTAGILLISLVLNTREIGIALDDGGLD